GLLEDDGVVGVLFVIGRQSLADVVGGGVGHGLAGQAVQIGDVGAAGLVDDPVAAEVHQGFFRNGVFLGPLIAVGHVVGNHIIFAAFQAHKQVVPAVAHHFH